jgi:hypothetical protein
MGRSDVVVWVHGDCLSPYGPALQAYPDAPALFVWDDDLLAEWAISLKRVVFIYESLLELPVAIRRGNVAGEVLRFVAETGAKRVVTAESPSPRFQQITAKIRHFVPVEILPVAPFVDHPHPERLDLRRASRYWRQVEKYALTRGGR